QPGMTPGFKKRKKFLTHFREVILFFEHRISNERVRVTGSIATGQPVGIPRPEGSTAFGADLPLKAVLEKIIQLIFVL
ncbi:MAG: hypothetical protein MUO40_12255, partial [Anaerolineaceae bacterium]|nr:hypothetical protein [Anaerolineaceae bacterium]